MLKSSCQNSQDFSEFPEFFLEGSQEMSGLSFPSAALMRKGVEGNCSSASCWDERVGILLASSVGHCESCWLPSRDAKNDTGGLEHVQRQK